MIGERWQQVLYAHGDAVALHHPQGRLTFAQIDESARALATAEDHVLAQGGAAEILIALVAGFLAGKPVHVVEKDRVRRVPAIDPPRGTCLIKQTVGGTGVRRCQFFSAAQILADVDRLHHVLALDRHGVCVAAISPAHSYGLTVTVLQTVLNGVPMHYLPEPFPSGLVEALNQHERAFLPGIPALWRAWLMASVDLRHVSLAVSAGSPLTLELERRALDSHGLKLHNLYGTSECGAVAYDATSTLRDDATTLGTLMPGISVRRMPRVGYEELIHIQSDAVGLGYDETFANEVFGDGVFQPMDLVRVRQNELEFIGSIGNGINVAGRKLSPEEIAAKLRAATGVQNLVVKGMESRDPERCQEVVAIVGMPREKLTMAFRQQACQGLAPWEIPRRWQTME